MIPHGFEYQPLTSDIAWDCSLGELAVIHILLWTDGLLSSLASFGPNGYGCSITAWHPVETSQLCGGEPPCLIC